jgi:hypothetical protein
MGTWPVGCGPRSGEGCWGDGRGRRLPHVACVERELRRERHARAQSERIKVVSGVEKLRHRRIGGMLRVRDAFHRGLRGSLLAARGARRDGG